MEMKEINIKILPNQYKKLEKLATKRGQTVDEFLFDLLSTDKYSYGPVWLLPLFVILAFILGRIFGLIF